MDKNWNKNLQERLTMFPAPPGAFHQLGRQGSWKQGSSYPQEKDANWDLYLLCDHPCSYHWAHF